MTTIYEEGSRRWKRTKMLLADAAGIQLGPALYWPKDWYFTQAEVYVNVPFNGSGTNLLKVGTTSGGSDVAININVNVAAGTTILLPNVKHLAALNPMANAKTLYAAVTFNVADATQGELIFDFAAELT